jgi:hypothetical protein
MKEVHENVKPELAKQITLWLAGKGLRKKIELKLPPQWIGLNHLIKVGDSKGIGNYLRLQFLSNGKVPNNPFALF